MATSTNELPTIDDQLAEARKWAVWLREAGYEVGLWYTASHGDGTPRGFDREWQVWTPERDWWLGPIATIDIDGCGASWHGPDDLWLKVVGTKVGVTD